MFLTVMSMFSSDYYCLEPNGNDWLILQLQKCFGCAVAAMGAENILRLVPVSFNVENLTYANMWMLPILKKYTCGASLGYFMEQIVPIAQSLQKASHKGKLWHD